MTRTILMASAMLGITACSSEPEIQLLSADDRHMMYVHLSDMKAEMYGGISMLASFDLKLAKENAYAFTPSTGDVGVVGFIHYPDKGTWRCPACPKYGLSADWKEI